MARTTAGLLAGAAVALLAFTAAEAQTARKGDSEREQTRQLNQEQLRMIQGRAGGMDTGTTGAGTTGTGTMGTGTMGTGTMGTDTGTGMQHRSGTGMDSGMPPRSMGRGTGSGMGSDMTAPGSGSGSKAGGSGGTGGAPRQ